METRMPGGHPDRILGLLERQDALQRELDYLGRDDTVNAARLQSRIEETQRFLSREESIHIGNYNTGIKSPADGIMAFAAIVAVPAGLIFTRSYFARLRHRYRPYTPVKLERLAYAHDRWGVGAYAGGSYGLCGHCGRCTGVHRLPMGPLLRWTHAPRRYGGSRLSSGYEREKAREGDPSTIGPNVPTVRSAVNK
jgi:hypothetical protein